MKKNDWWKPNNLKNSEKNFVEQNDLGQLDAHNDFGSYKLMLALNDRAKSKISSHNETTPSYRVKAIKKILGDFDPQKIYDVGCGLGFTTNEISKEYPRAEVVGMDISDDAIAYGKKYFPDCQFFSEAVDPENKKQVFPADLICAFEFYPFTRTSNLSDQRLYLIHLTDNLTEEGKLVIFQLWDNPESLSVNYEELVSSFPKLNFELHSMPIRQIGKFVRSPRFSNVISEIARPIFRGITGRQLGRNKTLVISKK